MVDIASVEAMVQKQVDEAVAERFKQLIIQQRSGDYLYGDHRCAPEQLGWRFRQTVFAVAGGPQMYGTGLLAIPKASMPDEIRAGKWDAEIESTLHNAAAAGHWYRFEKDYGRDE